MDHERLLDPSMAAGVSPPVEAPSRPLLSAADLNNQISRATMNREML
jgi:hypothetical protein